MFCKDGAPSLWQSVKAKKFFGVEKLHHFQKNMVKVALKGKERGRSVVSQTKKVGVLYQLILFLKHSSFGIGVIIFFSFLFGIAWLSHLPAFLRKKNPQLSGDDPRTAVSTCRRVAASQCAFRSLP